MKKILLFCSYFLLISCTGLSTDKDNDRNNQGGNIGKIEEIKLPTDLESAGIFSLKNCKSELTGDVNSNLYDLVLDIFKIDNKLKQIRACLTKTLEDGQNRICDSRFKLENKKKRTKGKVDKQRIDNSLERLEQIEENFNENWATAAESINKQVRKLENKKSKGVKRVLSGVAEHELRSYQEIFDSSSFSSCFTDEDTNKGSQTQDDKFRRERNSNLKNNN